MADQKLSALPLTASPNLADRAYLVQAGTSKQISLSDLLLALGNIHPSATVNTSLGAVDLSDYVVYVDPPVAGTTLDLPAISDVPDRVYCIRNRDTGGRLVTLVPNGTDTIEGSASLVIYASESVCVHADLDTSAWYVI